MILYHPSAVMPNDAKRNSLPRYYNPAYLKAFLIKKIVSNAGKLRVGFNVRIPLHKSQIQFKLADNLMKLGGVSAGNRLVSRLEYGS
jgi:hypothetical protein